MSDYSFFVMDLSGPLNDLGLVGERLQAGLINYWTHDGWDIPCELPPALWALTPTQEIRWVYLSPRGDSNLYRWSDGELHIHGAGKNVPPLDLAERITTIYPAVIVRLYSRTEYVSWEEWAFSEGTSQRIQRGEFNYVLDEVVDTSFDEKSTPHRMCAPIEPSELERLRAVEISPHPIPAKSLASDKEFDQLR
jgi:hypothetical protein